MKVAPVYDYDFRIGWAVEELLQLEQLTMEPKDNELKMVDPSP